MATTKQNPMMVAWCVECKSQVQVFWEPETDEDGKTIETPVCSECYTQIDYCYDCRRWTPENPNTPLAMTNGKCERHNKPVHAMTLICGHFRKTEA